MVADFLKIFSSVSLAKTRHFVTIDVKRWPKEKIRVGLG